MHWFIPSPMMEGSTLLGDYRGSRIELEPVRTSAVANLKTFQYKVLKDRRNHL